MTEIGVGPTGPARLLPGWLRAMLGGSLLLGTAVTAATASPEWQQASSAHFVVYSTDTPEHVKAFTTRLERYDKAMHVLRGRSEEAAGPSARVTVFVVRNVDAVQRLMGRGGGDVAGFYVPRAEGSVAFIPQSSGDGSQTALTAQQVLLHEYAHHITFSMWGRDALPAWFVEGFAEFNATASFNADGSMTFGAPPLYRARTMLQLQEVPLRMLLTADPDRLPEKQRAIFYGRAWLLVHYLAFDEVRRRQLSTYLDAINHGRPSLEAAKAFGDIGRLDLEVNRYVLRPRLPAITLVAGEMPVATVSVRALTPAEAAAMPALILSKRGVDPKSAPAALAQARVAAAAWPTDPFVQNELAEAEFDAGHYAEARAAAERASAADPRSVHALMYQGMARMAVAVAARDTSPATWQAVRHWFTAANRLDPEDPWPLAAFYRSYAAAQQPPTANAASGLLYAHLLAPFDGSLSLAAAGVYLHAGKPDDARATLLPVSFDPHGGYAAAMARATLAALDRDGTDAAAAVLTAGRIPTGAVAGTDKGKTG